VPGDRVYRSPILWSEGMTSHGHAARAMDAGDWIDGSPEKQAGSTKAQANEQNCSDVPVPG
jgi:hypothetical protein